MGEGHRTSPSSSARRKVLYYRTRKSSIFNPPYGRYIQFPTHSSSITTHTFPALFSSLSGPPPPLFHWHPLSAEKNDSRSKGPTCQYFTGPIEFVISINYLHVKVNPETCINKFAYSCEYTTRPE